MQAEDSENLQSDVKSWWQVMSTLALLTFSYYISWLIFANFGVLQSFLMVPLLSLLHVRCFIIYHDCIHNNLFSQWTYNRAVGKILSLINLTPHHTWGGNHMHHHTHFGKLSSAARGDIPFATLEKYKKMSRLKKLEFRFHRHPLMPFISAFAYHIQMRFPLFDKKSEFLRTTNHSKKMVTRDAYESLLLHSLVVAGAFIFSGNFAFLFLTSVYLYWVIGFYAFYVQHAHDGAKYYSSKEWSHAHAAVEGSSYVKMHPVLEYFFASINYHHVHHWDSSIPNYSLKKVHNDRFEDDPRVYTISNLKEFFSCFDNKLWDTENKKWLKEFPSV